jgi:Activator of Hsp90 ATPase homolog 1-like protein
VFSCTPHPRGALQALTTAEFVAEIEHPPAMNLDVIGVTEIAAELGVSRQRAGHLTDVPDFPEPVLHPASGRLYTRASVTGRFLAIDRPHLLRFTWSTSDWPDPMVVSIVTVAFEPIGEDQTLMSIEHSLLPPDTFDEYQSGWAGVCDQLATFLYRLRKVERE